MAERKLILVADDHLNVRNILEFNLKRRDFEVVTAADGLTALSMAHRLHPKLFILDIMMPGLDGFQVLEKMRNWSPAERPPTLILSARGTEGDIMRALQLGASDFIVKPFNMDVLLQKISTLITGGGVKLEKTKNAEDKEKDSASSSGNDQEIAEAGAAPFSHLIAVLPVPVDLAGEKGDFFAEDILALLRSGGSRIVLDAAGKEMDFAEIPAASFIKVIQEARKRESAVKWCVDPAGAERFKQTGLADHFEFFTSLEKAIRSFEGAASGNDEAKSEENAGTSSEVEEIDLLEL